LTESNNLLTIAEATELLKISKTTIYDMVKDGRLPSVSLPGVRRVFVRRSDLERLINEK
jgi:excisionase family DNA binding protein